MAGPAFGERSGERTVAGLWERQRHGGLHSLRRRQGADCPSIATAAKKGGGWVSEKKTGGGGGGGATEKAETIINLTNLKIMKKIFVSFEHVYFISYSYSCAWVHENLFI